MSSQESIMIWTRIGALDIKKNMLVVESTYVEAWLNNWDGGSEILGDLESDRRGLVKIVPFKVGYSWGEAGLKWYVLYF